MIAFKKRKKEEAPKPILKSPILKAGIEKTNIPEKEYEPEPVVEEVPEEKEDFWYKPEQFTKATQAQRDSDLFNLLLMIYVEVKKLNEGE